MDGILPRIVMGEALSKILEDAGMPSYTAVAEWLHEDATLAEKYARARQDAGDYFADEIREEIKTVVDSESAAAARVRIDALKWLAGKRKPKVYGDSSKVEIDAKVQVEIKDHTPSIADKLSKLVPQTLS